MGKYQNSDIHDKYSDFHYYLLRINKKYKVLYMTDTHIPDKHYWKFRVESWPDGNTIFNGHTIGYADWLLSLRNI